MRRQRPLPAKPEFVAAADLDGDGFDELLATTIAPGRLLVWRGSPGGLERAARSVPIGGFALRPIALERDAGTGRRPVAIVSREARTLTVLDPLGPDAATPLATLPLPATPRAAASGDLGGDGTLEIVLALDGRRLVAVRDARIVAEAELGGELARCVHVQSDGRAVLVGFQPTRSLEVLAWSRGGFGEVLHDEALGGMPRAIAEGDLDGDGDPELVVAGGDRDIWLFGRGAAGGTEVWFARAPERLSAAAIPLEVFARDLDGLPGAEIVALTHMGLTLDVWGGLVPQARVLSQSVYAGQSPTAAALLDADGDGRLDAVVANRDSLALSTVAGAGGGRLVADERTSVGGFPNAISVADLDGDGAPDAFTLDSKSATLSVLLNDGGVLRPAQSVPVGPAPRGARAVDLDRDGRLDVALLVQDAGGARVVRLFGAGDGSLERRAAAPDQGAGPAARDLLVLDATGDGALELVVVDEEGDRLLVLGGDAGGTLVTRLEVALASGPAALAVLEADGDPAPEIAVALAGAGDGRGLALLELSGGDDAIEVRFLHRVDPGSGVFDLATADLDGDGSAELLALAAADPDGSPGKLWPVRVVRGAGGPRLAALAPVATALAPRDVAAGDLDGDGRAEVLVAAQFSHVLDLWRARGSGATLALERLDDVGAGIGPMALAIADVDRDGVPDLVVANGHSDDVSTVLGSRRRD